MSPKENINRNKLNSSHLHSANQGKIIYGVSESCGSKLSGVGVLNVPASASPETASSKQRGKGKERAPPPPPMEQIQSSSKQRSPIDESAIDRLKQAYASGEKVVIPILDSQGIFLGLALFSADEEERKRTGVHDVLMYENKKWVKLTKSMTPLPRQDVAAILPPQYMMECYMGEGVPFPDLVEKPGEPAKDMPVPEEIEYVPGPRVDIWGADVVSAACGTTLPPGLFRR
ncbi:hypothetical protein RUND412_009283 [Rhizina undulata]